MFLNKYLKNFFLVNVLVIMIHGSLIIITKRFVDAPFF